MSNEQTVDGQVDAFFARHMRSDPNLDDIDALEAVLPDDPTVLSRLATRCLEESRKALKAGHHMEGRRLDILGWQLRVRAQAKA
jgi:hypothetical protein